MIHEYNMRVNLDDLDFMRIIGHSQWLIVFERARTHLFNSSEYQLGTLYDEGYETVISQLRVRYLRSAFFEDEIVVKTKPLRQIKHGIVLKQQAMRAGKICVDCHIGLVFTKDGRAVDCPAKALNLFFPE